MLEDENRYHTSINNFGDKLVREYSMLEDSNLRHFGDKKML